MMPPKALRPHGGVRGANLSRSSLLFDGPFGRMFRAVPPADFGATDVDSLKNLAELASKMISAADPPKDGPDSEESGIPSAFTYFGQFIDHDLTFDPASSLQKQNDPDALVDYRTPKFDLDNVYGRGPDDQPYMYEKPRGAASERFVLGKVLTGAPQVNSGAHDLQRNAQEPARALIGDPRNDENVIVGQFQGLFHRLHNRIADDNPGWSFAKVQQSVRFHYQWVLLHDFLPKLISSKVLNDLLPKAGDGSLIVDKKNLHFFHTKDEAFMPLEFSAAAYRFGHSMIRPGYRLNDDDRTLLPIFTFGEKDPDLRGFKAPQAGWAIDWRRFIDLEPLPYGGPIDNPDPKIPGNKQRLQLAYRIDTSLTNPLRELPPSIAIDPSSLALRNLERGWRMRLPSGQDVARAIGVKPLDPDKLVLGKFTGAKDDTDAFVRIDSLAGGVFADNCPLWTYVLAETLQHEEDMPLRSTDGPKMISTPKLGEVGGRIVGETFIGLLLTDSSSYVSLDPLWTPNKKYVQKGEFGLRELIAAALEFTIP
jgi:hypothetical protein